MARAAWTVATSQLDHERLGGQHPKTGSRDQRDAVPPGLAVQFEQLPHRLELVCLVQIVHSGRKAGPGKRQAGRAVWADCVHDDAGLLDVKQRDELG